MWCPATLELIEQGLGVRLSIRSPFVGQFSWIASSILHSTPMLSSAQYSRHKSDAHMLVGLQLLVRHLRRHSHTLANGKVLHFRSEAAPLVLSRR